MKTVSIRWAPVSAGLSTAMLDKAIENVGATPKVLSADAGYWSAAND